VAWDEAYFHAEFYLDPSNRLATIHNVTDRQDCRTDMTDNGPMA